MIDPTDNIRHSIEYARRRYGAVSPERLAQIAREKAQREALAASMRPRLTAALDAYQRLTLQDGLIGDLAGLHRPRQHRPTSSDSHCEGCDIDGMDPEEPRWPCTTARWIAEAHGIDLEGIETYEWWR